MAAGRRKTQQYQSLLAVDDFICGICREILKSPRQLPCSHIFCTECLQRCKETRSNQDAHSCPCCRENYSPHQERVANDVADKIRNCSSECPNCNERIPLRRMQSHLNTCDKVQLDERISIAMGVIVVGQRQEDKLPRKLPVATGFGVLQNQRRNNLKQVPGTFDCPYCNAKKLGRESLLQHVLAQHKGAEPNVVCPICAAMPWGNPNQKSQDFPQHIQLRHKFDYDYFVDMNKEEEAVFEETLRRSMFDQGRFNRP